MHPPNTWSVLVSACNTDSCNEFRVASLLAMGPTTSSSRDVVCAVWHVGLQHRAHLLNVSASRVRTIGLFRVHHYLKVFAFASTNPTVVSMSSHVIATLQNGTDDPCARVSAHVDASKEWQSRTSEWSRCQDLLDGFGMVKQQMFSRLHERVHVWQSPWINAVY